MATGAVIVLSLGGVALAQDEASDRGQKPDLFEALDADGNGEITRAEVEASHAKRFTDADANGDGFLSADELQTRAENRRNERFARMVERHDTDGDGLLSPEELRSDRGDKMFERLDENEDGIISTEEAGSD